MTGEHRVGLSFVVPVYGSPDSLRPLCQRVRAVSERLGLSHEVILVDDRCPRGSWTVAEALSAEDPAVVSIRLSRNFGQHAAIQAGLTACTGEWVVVMDCDLQDQPEEVPALLERARQGYDVVRARRGRRQDPWHRRIASEGFYRVLGYLTGTRQSPEIANFGVYHRRVIDAVTAWQEELKYFPAIIQWVGFSQSEVSVQHANRFEGRSSYGLRSLIRLGVNVIVGFSDKPLRLVMAAGLVMAAASFAVSMGVLAAHIMGAVTVEGWASIVLSLWFLSGCVLASLGLIGLYIGRILSEAKGRPTYIVDRQLGGLL